MEYFKKIETLVIWSVIVLLAIVYGVLSNKADAPSDVVQEQSVPVVQEQVQQVPATTDVKYQGEDGRNAMNLLKANYRVETQSFGDMGEFVKSIDGIEPDNTHFWALYINGTISQVGAEVYVTKSSDQIEWKLEKIQ